MLVLLHNFPEQIQIEVAGETRDVIEAAHSVVVDRHHGTLTLDSVVGTGTTFTLRIPVRGKPRDVDPGVGADPAPVVASASDQAA